jgi:TolB protein
VILLVIGLLLPACACGSGGGVASPAGVAEQPTPTTNAGGLWPNFADPQYGVSLQVPAEWQPVAGYEKRYGGPDGFFQLSAAGEGISLDYLCDITAHHKLKPYGSAPTIERRPVAGRDACLILPSSDQPPLEKGSAALIVPYPTQQMIGSERYQYFVLYADEEHITQIADSLQFTTGGS